MNLKDIIVNAFKADIPTSSKAPQYIVTNFRNDQNYNDLLDSQNYLNQYFGWTYKAVDTVVKGLLPHKPKLKQKKGDKWVEVDVDDSQLLTDLQRFNPYMDYNQARAFRTIHLRLAGLAVWFIAPSDDKNHKLEFYPLDPLRTKAKTNSVGLPEAYIFRDINGSEHTLPLDQLVIFRYANPTNWLKGFSPLQASRLPHNTWQLAYEMNMNMFGNMNKPEGILAFDGISETDRKKIETDLRRKYGGRKKAGKTAVSNFVPTWIPLTIGNKEMQMKEGMEMMREDILSFQGVPKPLVGLTDSTFTNSKEAQGVFQRYTLLPELTIEADVMNQQLIPNYFMGIRKVTDIKFVADDPVEEDKKEQSEIAVSLYQGGVIRLNEARLRIGEDEDPNGDTYYTAQPIAKPVIEADEDKTIKKKSSDWKIKREELKNFFEKKTIEEEAKVTTVARKFFNRQGERIIASVQQKALLYTFNTQQEITNTINYFDEIYNEIAVASNNVANNFVNGNIQISDRTKRHIANRLRRFGEEITSTTEKDLLRIFERATEEGWGTEELKDAITFQFNRYSNGGEGIEETRAEMIARTETTGVSNLIYRNNYTENEAVEELEWLSAKDRYVRHTHAQADGQRVKKDQMFSVGSDLLAYPGDPNGSAEEVINCRCVVLGIVPSAEV